MSKGKKTLSMLLRRAQELGYVGPGDIEDHIAHATRYYSAVGTPGRALDLGSGGGLPGLVLASELVTTEWFFLDGSRRRCQFLREAISDLGLEVTVLEGRAEELARRRELRHSMDIVVARSFGGPAVTAECATGFLCGGGRLIVSEPPKSEERWDLTKLGKLAMTVESSTEVAVIRQLEECGERWPRRTGVPMKRPLF